MPHDHTAFKKAFDAVCRTLRNRDPQGFKYSEVARDRAKDFASNAIEKNESITWDMLRDILSGPEVFGAGNYPTDYLDRPLSATGVMIRLSARIALALATNNKALIRPGEREFAKEAGYPQWYYEVANDPAVENDYIRPGRDAQGRIQVQAATISLRRARHGEGRTYLKFFARVFICVADRENFNLACRLRTPGKMNGELSNVWLDVLERNEKYYRPILGPLSWQPVSLPRFIEAMKAGEAWRDHPLATVRREEFYDRTDVHLHIDDIAADGKPNIRSDQEYQQELEKEVENKLYDLELTVINNIVYRKTDYPEIKIVATFKKGILGPIDYKTKLCWECGNLVGWGDPDPLMPSRVVCVIDKEPYPIKFEPIIRMSAVLLGVSDSGPIVHNQDDQEYSGYSYCDIISLSDIYLRLMRVVGLTSKELIAVENAAGKLTVASESNDLSEMKNEMNKIRALSYKITRFINSNTELRRYQQGKAAIALCDSISHAILSIEEEEENTRALGDGFN